MRPKMEKISIWDRLTGGAITKQSRNALAEADYNEAESQHSERLMRAKRGQRMMAQRKKKERNALAMNGDSEGAT